MNSLWLSENFGNKYKKNLDSNINCDVCIVGAGIFGLTCAYYLSKCGLKVVVIDKNGIAEKTTGHTTAKITSQHGLFYTYLINSYSEEFARDYLLANENAIKNIENIINLENINCDFEKQSSFVYTTKKDEINKIKKEVDNVNKLGLHANFVTKTGLPFEIEGAVQFPNQAQFNPLKYVHGLCKNINEIYTNTTVYDIKHENGELNFFTTGGTIHSKYGILASHYPFLNFPGMYFFKMYQSTSYIIGIDTKKTLGNGMYITASSPTYSFRTANYNGKKILLLGGLDHKTGFPVSPAQSYEALENYAKSLYPNCEILFRWDTNDCITLDKIPYIGLFSNVIDNLYVGTGFNKWGMTSSNVAANIVCDQILGKENKYSYVFNSNRVNPIKNHTEMKNMIVESTESLFIKKIKDSSISFDNIESDSGGIIEINKQKVGIYKHPSGELYAVKPICTHLGCLLSWNDTDKTWDCPCHGSRFDYKGNNIHDPAFLNLESYDLNS
ncbi:MAG: FAD-dependent oxidoreductase [Clostridia bacterium]|nr:FAD-dependent oxidoreductase [Clostridia bacterium]